MARVKVSEILRQVEIDQVATRLGMSFRDEAPNRKLGLCPFHQDTNPSLLIDTSRDRGLQHYHCFACGAHGTAVDLVKGRLETDFVGAIHWLESTFALRVGEQSEPAAERLDALVLALSIYRASSKWDKLKIWAESRGFSSEFLANAGLTYAAGRVLASPERLKKVSSDDRLESLGVLEDVGLVRKLLPTVGSSQHLNVQSETQYVDAFIGDRIIFPICNGGGKLVGLAARATGPLEALQKSKYLFSRGFPKAQILYRAEHAFAQIRKQSTNGNEKLVLFVCEGFLDALRIESLNLPAVAIMGAAISKDQVQLLKDLNNSLRERTATFTIALCMDRDEAGLRAASSAALALLDSGLSVVFVWPTTRMLSARDIVGKLKDPDEYLKGLDSTHARQLIDDSTRAPGLAVLAQQFGASADDILDDEIWSSATESRKTRAFQKAIAQLKRIKSFDNFSVERWIQWSPSSDSAVARDWLNYLKTSSVEASASSVLHLTSERARMNHARLLAYRGSRRGELACDEPRWERLDIAATAFNIVLAERLNSKAAEPIGAFDAVWVPRSFGGSEPRLKVMPLPEDLIIHQYMMNELLSEKWDAKSTGPVQFSQYIPAVRYYREEGKTVTTGLRGAQAAVDGCVRDGAPLSFAYQVDMDVIEGRQPATDQGMFRPFHECWHDFMSSLKRQATAIGHVHAIRLDVSRYYDRIRRSVVRDALHAKLSVALGTLPEGNSVLDQQVSTADGGTAEYAAQIVDRIGDLIFGYPYRSPDDGRVINSDALRGIPQGPVISAWIGTITLFPVDEVAAELMDQYNTDGAVRIGYARYVDDIVLLAESASLLERLRTAIDDRTRSLDLTLLAKADSIPPMTAREFTSYLNEGRMLDSSGPTWVPPIVGDGESGWEPWFSSPSSDRQSALQLLSNLDLYKSSATTIVDTVKTAFLATDLRATELSKGARLIWYAVAFECIGNENSARDAARAVWKRFEQFWTECTQAAGWSLDPVSNQWEAMHLFALEGLEKLIDHTGAQLRGLTADEDKRRQKRILFLAAAAVTNEFKDELFSLKTNLNYQTQRRWTLLYWKAAKVIRHPLSGASSALSLSLPFHAWRPFEWFHAAIESLSAQGDSSVDPVAALVEPFKALQVDSRSAAVRLFEYLLPKTGEAINRLDEIDVDLASSALQTVASIVPREHVFSILQRRPRLLAISDSEHYIFMPPLPGITQQHLIACKLSDDPAKAYQVTSLAGFGFVGKDAPPPFLMGSNGGVEVQLANEWADDVVLNSIVKRTANITGVEKLQVRVNPLRSAESQSNLLSFAAQMYRKIVRIVVEYRRQHPGKELVPAWPYISQIDDAVFLLTEGVSEADLGNMAFIRDGGRALRSIEVPIFEAHLWRAGMALTDFLGFHDDITKFGTSDAELPLDDNTVTDFSTYVLRSQCRKLRGTFADSTILKKRGKDSELPATIERGLQILEDFPHGGNGKQQLKYVLATETETAAMRFRIRNRRNSPHYTQFLSTVVSSVVSRLPLQVASHIATHHDDLRDLRRDLSGILAFSRSIHALSNADVQSDVNAWLAFQSGVVLLGIRFGIEGLVKSLRAHPEFTYNQTIDFPAEWEIPAADNEAGPSGEGNSRLTGTFAQGRRETDPVESLRNLVRLLGYRLQSDSIGRNHIAEGFVTKLKALALTLHSLDAPPSAADEIEWPFSCVNSSIFKVLRLELLESVANLCRELDEELGLQVTLVREHSYGFNAQTRRFTDSRNQTWDLNLISLSQFPLGTKTVEEEQVDAQIQRVWTEVHDRRTGRLLGVSVLGEPFATIAISGAKSDDQDRPEQRQPELVDGLEQQPVASPQDSLNSPWREASNASVNSAEAKPASRRDEETKAEHGKRGHPSSAHEFRRRQQAEWNRRALSRDPSHVRVAFLQWNADLTYAHPIVECCPTGWPMGKTSKQSWIKHLKNAGSDEYKALLKATEQAGNGFEWDLNGVSLKSWPEHRRRRLLKRTINACEDFGVDLLVLPEYSVRPETVGWLKIFLAGKRVSVLAGTYLEFSEQAIAKRCSAVLSLLWPLPDSLLFSGTSQQKMEGAADGKVLLLQRSKKYRSVGLDEFIRPSTQKMFPLFRPGDLIQEIEQQYGSISGGSVIKLLSSTRLPLRHLIEMVCSEVFLLTSPANYPQMANDYSAMMRRFGLPAEPNEVRNDVEAIAALLAVGSDSLSRRSIVVVPAATTRTADYWIAGQAALLAAGTTTIFCNGTGYGSKGGSCFIGRASWKNKTDGTGIISSVTPYHGWSKGIYYNSPNDPLSDGDQAMVIADIDPVHMVEGKPRPQLLPIPLQLVAYLPVVETVNRATLNQSVCRQIPLANFDPHIGVDGTELNKPLQCEKEFWDAVSTSLKLDDRSLVHLSKFFSDPKAFLERLRTARNDGKQQPWFSDGVASIFNSPALYDWLDVSLSLDDTELIPEISVPPWR